LPTDTRTRSRKALAGGTFVAALVAVTALIVVSFSSPDSPGSAPKGLFRAVPQHGIAIGAADAPVTVIEFADLQCPFCAGFAGNDLPGIVADYVRPGEVRMELRLLAFLGSDSETGRGVAAAVAGQDRLWPFAENVFLHQGTEGSGYMDLGYLADQAEGIDGLDAEAALAAAGSARGQRYASVSDQLAEELGVNSTPSFVVTGGDPDSSVVVGPDDLRGAIDTALAGP
jgi:protein-disulfide isomerase